MQDFHRVGANHTCFTCGHFRGLMGARANCGNRRLSPIHDNPAAGCNRWAFDPTANREIWTVEDWHVHASQEIPGFAPPPLNRFRPALVSAALHDLHAAHPSPGTVAMAWEIARLHNVLTRVRSALLELRKDKMSMTSRVHLRRMAERLLEEPGVREAIEREEMQDQIQHRGQ